MAYNKKYKGINIKLYDTEEKFSIRQNKYNVKFIQNDAIAAIIPHKYGSFITSHRMKSELENCLPFSKSINVYLKMIC